MGTGLEDWGLGESRSRQLAPLCRSGGQVENADDLGAMRLQLLHHVVREARLDGRRLQIGRYDYDNSWLLKTALWKNAHRNVELGHVFLV